MSRSIQTLRWEYPTRNPASSRWDHKGFRANLKWFLPTVFQAPNNMRSYKEWALESIQMLCLAWGDRVVLQAIMQWFKHTANRTATMWWNELKTLQLITHLAYFSFFFFSNSFAALPGVDMLRCIPVIMRSANNITKSRPKACIWNPYLVQAALPEAGALVSIENVKWGTIKIRAAHFSPVIRRSEPMMYM